MMQIEEFREYAHQIVDWMADYFENIEDYPVKAQVKPGEIFDQLPPAPPQEGESMDSIMEDFTKIILPGMTHWQSPNFHAYFPANASYPSQLAEMLTSALASQCMIWDTSPAAAELEEQMMNWLKKMTGLPESWSGVIHDGASTATLTAILTAREKISNFNINKIGFSNTHKFRIYCSTEAHSSVEKAVRVAGIGDQNLVKISTDASLAMDPGVLEKTVINDINALTLKESENILIAIANCKSKEYLRIFSTFPFLMLLFISSKAQKSSDSFFSFANIEMYLFLCLSEVMLISSSGKCSANCSIKTMSLKV